MQSPCGRRGHGKDAGVAEGREKKKCKTRLETQVRP